MCCVHGHHLQARYMCPVTHDVGQFSALCCPQNHVCYHSNHLALLGRLHMWVGGALLE